MHRARDEQFNFIEVERLGNKIVGTAFHRFHGYVHRPVGRHHDAGRRAGHFQRAINQGHSIFAAETQVGKKHIDLLSLKHVYRARNIGGDIHIVFVLK